MNRTTVSSIPLLRAVLAWGGVVGGTAIVISGAIGFIISSGAGLWSGVLGALVGVVFPALTAVSILVANRWFGTPMFLQIFFGIVMGAWVVKFGLVIILMLVLTKLEWVVPLVFYIALVATAVASLVVDLIILRRTRVASVSDVELPQTNPEE